jgi:hypothetical protein
MGEAQHRLVALSGKRIEGRCLHLDREHAELTRRGDRGFGLPKRRASVVQLAPTCARNPTAPRARTARSTNPGSASANTASAA